VRALTRVPTEHVTMIHVPRTPPAFRAGLLLSLLTGAGLFLGGCEAADPSVVIEGDGWQLTADDLRADFARVNAGSSIEAASPDERLAFIEDRTNAELLARHARETIDELSWPRKRKLWAEQEEALFDAYFEGTWSNLQISPGDRDAIMSRMEREAHLRRIVAPSMEVARECHRRIVEDGLGFEAAYAEYGLDNGTVTTELDLGWVTADALPNKVLRNVFLEDMRPGEVRGPIHTARGIWIIELVDIRDVELSAATREHLGDRVRAFCYQDSLRAHSERRHRELGFRTFDENFPVVNRCFNAFWDSISVEQPRANTNVFRTWRAPVWHLAPEERAVPIYEFDGIQGTALDFMRSLDRCDTRLWPSGPTPEHRAKEIRVRVERLFIEHEAKRLGLHETSGFRAAMERAETEAYLDDFFERKVKPEIHVTPEEAAAEYDRDPDAFRLSEKVAFAALLFPKGEADAARSFREEHVHTPVREWMLAARELAATDSTIVLIRDSGVIRADAPPRDPVIQGLLPHALELTTSEVSEVIELAEGVGILRCSYRVEERAVDRATAMPWAEAAVRRRKVDERIDALLEELRRRHGVQVYPDHLTASVEDGAAS